MKTAQFFFLVLFFTTSANFSQAEGIAQEDLPPACIAVEQLYIDEDGDGINSATVSSPIDPLGGSDEQDAFCQRVNDLANSENEAEQDQALSIITTDCTVAEFPNPSTQCTASVTDDEANICTFDTGLIEITNCRAPGSDETFNCDIDYTSVDCDEEDIITPTPTVTPTPSSVPSITPPTTPTATPTPVTTTSPMPTVSPTTSPTGSVTPMITLTPTSASTLAVSSFGPSVASSHPANRASAMGW